MAPPWGVTSAPPTERLQNAGWALAKAAKQQKDFKEKQRELDEYIPLLDRDVALCLFTRTHPLRAAMLRAMRARPGAVRPGQVRLGKAGVTRPG